MKIQFQYLFAKNIENTEYLIKNNKLSVSFEDEIKYKTI